MSTTHSTTHSDPIAAYYDFDQVPPHETSEGAEHWYAPATNFVVCTSRLEAGARVVVTGHPDEHCLVLPTGAASVHVAVVGAEHGAEDVEARENSLVVLPPGDSTITALESGFVHRVFSRFSPVHAHAAAYAQPSASLAAVADLEAWPEPVGGFALRRYALSDFEHLEGKQRIFRTTNMMIKLAPAKDERRDPATLSPHSHDDFEQASLVVHGRWVHHMRVPWGRDSSAWLDDEHRVVGSPSVTVIPPPAVHTSQSIGEHLNQLIDIFAPPRVDFSLAGRVTNELDYPMPPELA